MPAIMLWIIHHGVRTDMDIMLIGYIGRESEKKLLTDNLPMFQLLLEMTLFD